MKETRENVVLRPIKEEELEQIMEWRMRPDITQFMYTDPILTLEDQKRWYEKIKQDKTSYVFIIEVDMVPIGLLQIMNIDWTNRRCVSGFYIAVKEKRSLKLSVRIIYEVYEFVFNKLKLNKIERNMFADNKGVIQLHQLCGSEIEGTLRQHIYKNGQYHDIVYMGICKDKYEQLKETFIWERVELIQPEI